MTENPEPPAAQNPISGGQMDGVKARESVYEGAHIRPIHGVDLIRETITHPKVYPYVSDDLSPNPEDYQPVMHESVRYLGAYDGDTFHGLFMVHPVNGVTMEVHTCLLPSAYGQSVGFAALLLKWVWDNTGCARIITQVPEYNRLARKLAINSGMSEYGLNPSSFKKNGKLHNISLMGISREGVCQ